MILFLVGLIVVMGAVGGIENSPDNIGLFWYTVVAMIGLVLMWNNVKELNNDI